MIDRMNSALNIARNDENIRGVVLYGSRANDHIIPDPYQDYDLIFLVADRSKFSFSVFENVMLRFCPSEVYPELFQEETTCLMLFDDDTRIDLTVCTAEVFSSRHANGQSMKCLLDKDNSLNRLITADKNTNQIQKIDETKFNNTCAEFLWEIQNVAKGLKRDELSFAMFLRDIAMREMLNRVIDDYIGLKTGYSVTTGVLGKYRKKYLPAGLYEIYEKTYYSNTREDVWASVGYMIDLFGLTATAVAEAHGYQYPKSEELYMRDYIQRMKISEE